MPKTVFTIAGDVDDFTRLDNVYRTLKREAEKLFTGWKLDVAVTYEESQGDKPVSK